MYALIRLNQRAGDQFTEKEQLSTCPELDLQYQEMKRDWKGGSQAQEHTLNTCSQEAEGEQVWGQPKLRADFEAILSYAIRSFLSAKTNKIKTWPAKMVQFFCILTHLFYLFNQKH